MSKKSSKIPPELQARIEEEDRRAFRNLDRVANELQELLKPKSVYAVHIFPHRGETFDAYIFFETDADLRHAERDGITQVIVDAVHDALERAGRGARGEIEVRFQFDSDEHVKTIPRGYFMRLR